MAYEKTEWTNGGGPAINASNLNKIEEGIHDAHRLAVMRPLTDLGMATDNTPTQNRDAFVSSLENSKDVFYLPPGDYPFDNVPPSGFIINVYGFEGILLFSPGARLVFQQMSEGGMKFNGGVGAVIDGWNSTFATIPTARVDAKECLEISNATDTLVTRCRINGSPSGGLVFTQCVRPSAVKIRIEDTEADGVHFANCEDALADDVVTFDTGDDGLAFINYADRVDLRGGRASNIVINDSDGRGITVGGQSDVEITNFEINGTNHAGVIVEYSSYWNTRQPQNVRISNGVIKGAGTYTGDLPPSSTRHGIFYSSTPENPASLGDFSANFSDIRVVGSGSRAVNGIANSGSVGLSGIEVEDIPDIGFVLTGREVMVEDCTARNTDGQGFVLTNCLKLYYNNITAINAARTGGSNLAIETSAEPSSPFAGQPHLVHGGFARVIDDQSQATGYAFKAWTGGPEVLRGSLGDFVFDLEEEREIGWQNQAGLPFASRLERRGAATDYTTGP